LSNNRNTAEPEAPYSFKTAPESRWLKPWAVTERQLRRAAQAGRISFVRIGNQVQFSDDNLREFLESRTVQAQR
jgi:excisionase family DNA binding protein